MIYIAHQLAPWLPPFITFVFVTVTAAINSKTLESTIAFIGLGTISMLGLASLTHLVMRAIGATTNSILFVSAIGDHPTMMEIKWGLTIQSLVIAAILIVFGGPLLRWLCRLLKAS